MDKKRHLYSKGLIFEYSKGRLKEPMQVKLFIGLIISPKMDINNLRQRLTKRFGPIEIESPIHPFVHTNYYNKEMGDGLLRCYWGFKRCIQPDQLAKVKLVTNLLELRMGVVYENKINRLVNIDPGILSLANVILATTKERAHRVYLGKGIYAEVTLLYSRINGWQALDWTYPDYRTDLAKVFFQRLRDIYYNEIIMKSAG